MQKIFIKTITAKDETFPAAFNQLTQPVKKFYAAGNLNLLSTKPRLGIVGSRKVTPYGRLVTSDMASSAARAGAVIVSGLALGVDSIAHQATLDAGGCTIAVLPSSIDNIYPASHRGLAERIVKNDGLLISEFENTPQPMKHYFIQRNRLIAALSDALLVTEATLRSGSRHTVEFMISLGRPVLAMPGDVNRSSSTGPNNLIKNGCEPILSSSDLLSILGLNENLMKPKYQPENDVEASILNNLLQHPQSFNELATAVGLEAQELNVNLTMLELKGAIAPSTNNIWRICG